MMKIKHGVGMGLIGVGVLIMTACGIEQAFEKMDESSLPPENDTQPPQNGSITINSGSSTAETPTVTLSLSAKDNLGLRAYYLSTESNKPTPEAEGWTMIAPTTPQYSGEVSYTFIASGKHTLYVWFKDIFGNVSNESNAGITLLDHAPS
ncbi:hypothetical protein WDW89_21850, partial [Deltaproteobacteria bacterium TL4]